jgi:peroxiredoxin
MGVAVAGSAATLGAWGPAKRGAKAKLGEKTPNWQLMDTTGKQHELCKHKGKIVVLEWINPQCPYVKGCYEGESMQNTYKAVKEVDEDIVWLAVNSTHTTSAEENARWIEKYDIEYPILIDKKGAVGHAFNARTTPHMFVIDAEGVLRYHGAIHDNPRGQLSPSDTTNYVLNAVVRIKQNETVAPDHVKPWGCSVKYKK